MSAFCVAQVIETVTLSALAPAVGEITGVAIVLGPGDKVMMYAREATALVVMPDLYAIAFTVVVPEDEGVILNVPPYCVDVVVGAELSRV